MYHHNGHKSYNNTRETGKFMKKHKEPQLV